MYYILYNSYAVSPFNDESLKELLMQAQKKNERLGITGMLFYFSGQFLQLIEGDENAVKQLGKEIAEDNRHKYFAILKEGHVENRFYKEWSMGFKSVAPENFEDVKNFRELNKVNNQNLSSFLSLLNVLSAKAEI